jgi:tRNA 2-thiouridine synthesizing protein A
MHTPTLDLRGLKCPLPALLARRALMRAAAGAALEVLADDPLAPLDLLHMCRQEGFDVLDVEARDAHTRFVLLRPLPKGKAR